MVDFNAISNSSAAAAAARPAATPQTLGQSDFLQLMLAQLRNQDPLKPMENGEFLGQMAQFSTVNGIQGLQDSVNDLAATFGSQRLLGATSLIGREVMLLSDQFEGGRVSQGAIELSASAPVRIRITSAAGELIQTLDLGTRNAGLTPFEIPQLPPGRYQIHAELGQGQTTTVAPVLLADQIRGVSVSRDGRNSTLLELAHLGSVALTDVRHFRQETD